MRSLAKWSLRKLGWELRRLSAITPAPPGAENFNDLSPEEREILRRVAPFTMTSRERLAALVGSIRYLVHHRIPGDIVECGVWRGGSMMAAALALRTAGDVSRTLHLFDTFEGMPPPGESDFSIDAEHASVPLARDPKGTGVWCEASLDDVRANVATVDYPPDRVRFVQGKVEDTLPAHSPDRIALLRLDTDWFESTRHELHHLFPLLQPGGILIIDDYGHWSGARRAVDEYLARLPYPTFLHRVDYTGRVLVKPPAMPTSPP
jgi:O-methyltransferase